METLKFSVSLPPYPAHCLEWLCERTGDKRSRVIGDALVQMSAELGRIKEESASKQNPVRQPERANKGA